jgi:hypothetical protein
MKTKNAMREAVTPKMPEDFERYAKALMAVPKKELDKELAKHERRKQSPKRRTKT